VKAFRYLSIGAFGFSLALSWLASAGAQSPTIQASLVDPAKNGARGAATVTVRVTGVKLVDPAASNETPRDGEGHLHYQLDGGPVIATTAAKLSFHGLEAGSHNLKVALAKNDHTPMGPEKTLTVQVTSGTSSGAER
jgi:hypothetical protein